MNYNIAQKLAAATIATLAVLSAASADAVELKSGEIDPEKKTPESVSGKSDFGIVHLEDSANASSINASSEVDLYSYLPEDSWYANYVEDASGLEGVESAFTLERSDRISPQLHRELRTDPGSERASRIRVEFFPTVQEERAREALGRYGNVSRKEDAYYLDTGTGRLDAVLAIGSREDVKWISQSEPEAEALLLEASRTIGAERTHSELGVRGEGSTIAIWDSGIAGNHPDIDPKTERRDSASITGHATHVAGIAAGSGSSNPNLDGIAPSASLLSYKWPVSSTSELFSETGDAASRGATVSHNSWGWILDSKEELSSYGSYSRAYDSVVSGRATEPMTVVFSAGNQGDNWNDPHGTITGTGATAKNTITVGAVTGNENLAEFSSRGPTDDGRLKPELVADGFYVKSPAPGGGYSYFSGTSAAAPAVSGAAALFGEAYTESRGSEPRPATVKAALIHSAKDLGPKGPDYGTGYGLVQADEAVELARSGTIIEDRLTDESDTDSYSFDSSTDKVTLVWSDVPAQQSAGKALVNDLELEVANSEIEIDPYTLDPSKPSEAASRGEDHNNVVEQVRIPESAGLVRVDIEAREMPVPAQGYTLVASGERSEVEKPFLEIKEPSEELYRGSPSLEVDAPESSEVTYSLGDGERSMKFSNGIYTASPDLKDGSYTVTFEASNSAGTVRKSSSFEVDTTPPDLEVVSPEARAYSSDVIDFEADSSSPVDLKVDGVETTFESSTRLELSEGDHVAEFTSTDEAGNTARKTVSFSVNTQTIDYGITSPTEKTYSGAVEVDLNVPGRHVLLLDGREITGQTSISPEPGSHVLVLRYVEDGETKSDRVEFVVEEKDDSGSGDSGSGDDGESDGTDDSGSDDGSEDSSDSDDGSKDDSSESGEVTISSTEPVNWNSGGTSRETTIDRESSEIGFSLGEYSWKVENSDLQDSRYEVKVSEVSSGVSSGIAVASDLPGDRSLKIGGEAASGMPMACDDYSFSSESCESGWRFAYRISNTGDGMTFTGSADAFGFR